MGRVKEWMMDNQEQPNIREMYDPDAQPISETLLEKINYVSTKQQPTPTDTNGVNQP